MPVSDSQLWTIIRKWPLPFREEHDDNSEPARTCKRFEHNLRKIGDWTDESSKRITEAYRRLLYLKAVSGETLAPPKWIDAAWHLHLSFPEDYAALEAAIGRKIVHHADLEWDRLYQTYERGRALWEVEFDEEPPLQMWPERLAWWRPWAGYGLVALTAAGLAAILSSTWVQSLHEGFAILFALAWLGSGVACAILVGSPSPDKISRCG